MKDLIELFKSFNRKERFFLIGNALGNSDFKLSEEYREKVGNILGLTIPQDAFVAMDYHLDWIYASLYCAQQGTPGFIADNKKLKLNSNQEDVDLIIAFKKKDIIHIILIEAKAESSWTNKQIESKAKRFKMIFGNPKYKWQRTKVHFLLTSPNEPQSIRLDVLPSYLDKDIKSIWFKLDLPDNLKKITRCDNKGNPDKSRHYWKVEKT